jgi:radical SAM protein with 4Fe4S-binding SPASM domain
MTRKTFLKAVPFLKTARLVILQGWGESLLHPDILWMVETCKAQGAMVGILTNGTLLDAGVSSALVDLQAEFLAVSLDAATPQTFKEVRGGDFDSVIANVARLAEEKRRRNSRYPMLQFSFCVMKKNLHEITKLVDLAEEHGVDEIVLNNLIVYSPDMQEQTVYDIPEEVDAVHREVKAKAESKGILLFYNGVNRIDHEPDCPFRNFAVLADGSVGPCGAQRVVLGNIADSPLRELWNGEAYRAMRRRYVNGDTPHACERCPNYTNAMEDHVDPDLSYVEETLGKRCWDQAATRAECANPRPGLLDIDGSENAG